MRKSCLDCTRKHIGQAMVLYVESLLGYPHHLWYAVGHLAEAETECINDNLELAQCIRIERLKMMEKEKPDFERLMIHCCEINSGHELEFDPNNSKKF